MHLSPGVEGKWTWGENITILELHAAKGSGLEEGDSGNGGWKRSASGGRAFRIGRGLLGIKNECGTREPASEMVAGASPQV